VLQVTEVEVKQAEDGGGSGDDGGGQTYELQGKITALDTAAATFVLRGVTVSYTGATFSGGTAANLAVEVKVEVKGTLAADGITVNATEIQFDD
jgi:hypothetical protein